MKNKWLIRLQEKHDVCTNITDTLNVEEKTAQVRTDRTDTLNTVSVMSVPTSPLFGENDMTIGENNPQVRTDRTDTVNTMLGISVSDRSDFEQNNRLNPQKNFFNDTNSSALSFSWVDDYEERLAIAEYDGQQDALQAHRIAYQDALITILNTNPPDALVKQDWLMDRINSAEGCLMAQGIVRPS